MQKRIKQLEDKNLELRSINFNTTQELKLVSLNSQSSEPMEDKEALDPEIALAQQLWLHNKTATSVDEDSSEMEYKPDNSQ